MCWYCCRKRRRRDPFAATSFPKFVPGPPLFNCRHTDAPNSSMEHAPQSVFPVDLDEGVLKDLDNQPLPVHASVLDHLQVRSGLVVDAQPFLDSLRRVYHEQLARSVSDAVAIYHSQLYRLEATWAPEGTTPGGNSSATTGSLEVLVPNVLTFFLAFATWYLAIPILLVANGS